MTEKKTNNTNDVLKTSLPVDKTASVSIPKFCVTIDPKYKLQIPTPIFTNWITVNALTDVDHDSLCRKNVGKSAVIPKFVASTKLKPVSESGIPLCPTDRFGSVKTIAKKHTSSRGNATTDSRLSRTTPSMHKNVLTIPRNTLICVNRSISGLYPSDTNCVSAPPAAFVCTINHASVEISNSPAMK
ncbi:MAG: hypothetical protein KGJ02_04350 [Verrucomicrobiota bacterium]|nr:hypothetical protein [Verrucomicrobiota bacterium]